MVQNSVSVPALAVERERSSPVKLFGQLEFPQLALQYFVFAGWLLIFPFSSRKLCEQLGAESSGELKHDIVTKLICTLA